MKTVSLLVLAGLAPLTFALQATTTHYYDGQKGACGCGAVAGSSLFPWQLGISPGVYTAAGSQALFDQSGLSWCGAGCGLCYQLTSTGAAPCSGCGLGGDAGQSIIVMVTNLCPNNGNAQWCPVVGGTNQYGYSYHFDIMAQSEIFGDNPVVNFEQVACPGAAVSDYSQCQCPSGASSGAPPPSSISTPSSSSKSTPPPSSTYTQPPVSTYTPPPSSPSACTSTFTSTSTTTITTTYTSSLTPTMSTSSPVTGGIQQHYGQCGGTGYTGPTQCIAGTTCQFSSQWYSQCL